MSYIGCPDVKGWSKKHNFLWFICPIGSNVTFPPESNYIRFQAKAITELTALLLTKQGCKLRFIVHRPIVLLGLAIKKERNTVS